MVRVFNRRFPVRELECLRLGTAIAQTRTYQDSGCSRIPQHRAKPAWYQAPQDKKTLEIRTFFDGGGEWPPNLPRTNRRVNRRIKRKTP